MPLQPPKFASFKSHQKQETESKSTVIVTHDPRVGSDYKNAPSAPFAYTKSTAVAPSIIAPKVCPVTRTDKDGHQRKKRGGSRLTAADNASKHRKSLPGTTPPLEQYESYTIDLIGDRQNVKYGRNGKIPAYRRRASCVIGLAPHFQVEALEALETGNIPSTTSVGFFRSRALPERLDWQTAKETEGHRLKHCAADWPFSKDYLPLSLRKQESQDAPMKGRLAFMYGPAQMQTDKSDEEVEPSDEEPLSTSIASQQANISRLVESDPKNEYAWMQLIRIQDRIVMLAKQVDDPAAQRGSAQVKIPILKRAMSAIPQSATLAREYMMALSMIKDKDELQDHWNTILKRIPWSMDLWTAYIDHLNLRFHAQYDFLLARQQDGLEALEAHHKKSKDKDNDILSILMMVFLNLLKLFLRFGYIELAVAHFQAMAQKLIQPELDSYDAINAWWDDEYPRIGETTDISNDVSTTAVDTVNQNEDALFKFAQAENQAMQIKPPLRVNDKSQFENDVHGVVLASAGDLNLFAIREADSSIKQQFLLGCFAIFKFDTGLDADATRARPAFDLFSLFDARQSNKQAHDADLLETIVKTLCCVGRNSDSSGLQEAPFSHGVRQQLQALLVSRTYHRAGYKPAKKLTKLFIAQYTSTPAILWTAFALLEHTAHGVEAARKVFELNLDDLPEKSSANERPFGIDRFLLQAAYVQFALRSISPQMSVELCQQMDLGRARCFVTENFDAPAWSQVLLSLAAVNGIQALYNESTDLKAFQDGFDEAKTRVSLIYKLKSCLLEQLYQLQCALLEQYATAHMVRPSVLRNLLYEAVLNCPANSLLLASFAKHEERFRVDARAWRLEGELLDNERPPSAAVIQNLLALEMMQSQKQGTAAQIRTLERFLSLDERIVPSAREDLLTQLLLLMDSQPSCESEGIRRRFFESTWLVTSKRFLMLPFLRLRRHFDTAQLQEVYELMLKRGIRLVGDLEDFFDL